MQINSPEEDLIKEDNVEIEITQFFSYLDVAISLDGAANKEN